MRTVIAHIHLFKNAGTTVERALESYFGDRWVSWDKERPAARIDQAELEGFLRRRPSVQAVSSHQLRPPLVDTDEFRWLPIVFIRHPIDRIRSAYDFERTQVSDSPSSRAAASMSFAEWIEFHDGKRWSQCRNFQTFALTTIRVPSGAPLARRPLEEHLESAQRFLSALPAFGLVEAFDETWDRVSTRVRGYHPDFAASAKRLNVTTSAAPTLGERLAAIEQALGVAAYGELVTNNEADLALHTWAETRAKSIDR